MKVGIAGFGSIGKVVGKALDQGIEGLELAAISVRNIERGLNRMSGFKKPVPVLNPQELADTCDIIVECVPKEAFNSFAIPALSAGRLFVTVSAAGILANPSTIKIYFK